MRRLKNPPKREVSEDKLGCVEFVMAAAAAAAIATQGCMITHGEVVYLTLERRAKRQGRAEMFSKARAMGGSAVILTVSVFHFTEDS